MSAMPKDGTPILAFCTTQRFAGWIVIVWNGRCWHSVPGKYGVSRIVAWAKLPMEPSTAPVLIAHDFQLYPSGDEQP